VNDVLVLCYHAVSERWPAPLSVTPDAFERQLRFLVDRGYRGATLTEALADRPPGRTAVVTFDDAYRSVRELALPIMEGLGLPGSVYVPTDWPDRGEPMRWRGIDHWLDGPHEHELTCMSWEELGEMLDERWEVGSHTRSHPRLTQLDDAGLTDELEGSREVMRERLAIECSSLAYPYGDADRRVVAAAERAGYRFAGTLPRRLHSPHPLDWPRVGVYHADSFRRWRLKVSPVMRRVRASRAWDVVEAVRRAPG
jgi:peptidoglycan/xylan/chitin deacetylase (PgdA/CDA1 family)